jgi:hypothetical protein
MMSNFTKGEWFAKREGQSTVYIECRIGSGWLQEVAACGPTANGSEEQEANAKLIAAAPDLLEALKNLENDNGQIPDHAWKLVRDAIAKATTIQ